MVSVYEGTRGNVFREYTGGTPSRTTDLLTGGVNTETYTAETRLDAVNGTTVFGTDGATGDSVYTAFPLGFRPGILADGVLREASGSLNMVARLGIHNRTNINMFIGIMNGQSGADLDVEGVVLEEYHPLMEAVR